MAAGVGWGMAQAHRLFRALLFAALLSLAAVSCADAPKGAAPRNVILISIDTLRSDHVGIYGYGPDTSPTMDRLALGGVFFEDVTAASPWTLPSHASMFTGLYPSTHGVKDHTFALHETTPTLATAFSSAGFQTVAFVNSHNIASPKAIRKKTRLASSTGRNSQVKRPCGRGGSAGAADPSIADPIGRAPRRT